MFLHKFPTTTSVTIAEQNFLMTRKRPYKIAIIQHVYLYKNKNKNFRLP